MGSQFLLRFLNHFSKSLHSIKLILLILVFLLNICVCDSNSLLIERGKDQELEFSDKIFAEIVIEKEETINAKDPNDFFINKTTTTDSTFPLTNKQTFQIQLYNEQAFHSVITKFKINSNRFIYMYYEEIKERLIQKINETIIYNLTSLDIYIQEKFNSDYENEIKNENNLPHQNYNIILLQDNLEFFQLLQTYFYHNKVTRTSYNFNYDGVIFHNETSPLNMVIQDIRHPLFQVNKSTFEELKKLTNIKKLKISVTYDNTSSLIPINFLRVSTYISIVIISILFLWWHFISFNLYPNNFQHIQKILTFILFIKLLITVLLFFYLIVIDADIKSQSAVEEMFLITSANTVNTIYKTLLLFTIILLSYGWKTIQDNFSRRKLQKLVVSYLIIYFSLCFDQMIDVPGNKFGYFPPSEIKNILMLSLIGFVVIKKSRENINFLKAKLMYAFEYSTDFVTSLRLKILMMFLLSIYSFVYCYVFNLVNFLLRIYFNKYDKYLHPISLINSNNLDLLFLFFLLYIFRARNFPSNFYIFYLNGDEENPIIEKPFHIYIAYVDTNAYKPSKELALLNKNKDLLNRYKNMPFIVVNLTETPGKFDIKQVGLSYLSKSK